MTHNNNKPSKMTLYFGHQELAHLYNDERGGLAGPLPLRPCPHNQDTGAGSWCRVQSRLAENKQNKNYIFKENIKIKNLQ